MRRSAQVLLVLMGGGLVTAAAVPLWRQQDCDPAVMQGSVCATGTSTSHSSSGRSVSRSTGADGTTSTASASVARGGFGATGAAHASSSGG
ncbi:MAG: DUF1190 domain-containing protein [Alphaproteobacteria bacterium]|nr:DUF1190 domain-containing protein [Alphaproteobacteria bacterium]